MTERCKNTKVRWWNNVAFLWDSDSAKCQSDSTTIWLWYCRTIWCWNFSCTACANESENVTYYTMKWNVRKARYNDKGIVRTNRKRPRQYTCHKLTTQSVGLFATHVGGTIEHLRNTIPSLWLTWGDSRWNCSVHKKRARYGATCHNRKHGHRWVYFWYTGLRPQSVKDSNDE